MVYKVADVPKTFFSCFPTNTALAPIQNNSPAPLPPQVDDINGTPRTVPIPPNIDTVNTLFGTDLNTEEDMVSATPRKNLHIYFAFFSFQSTVQVAWLDERRPKLSAPPANGEEMSISR